MRFSVRNTIHILALPTGVLIAGLLTFFLSQEQKQIIPLTDIYIAEAQSNDPSKAPNYVEMQKYDRGEITSKKSPRWLRVKFSVPETDIMFENLGLELSGPFSADIYLNQILIGTKGTPFSSTEEEIVSGIYSVIPLENVQQGQNDILIYFSSQMVRQNYWLLLQDFKLITGKLNSNRPASFYWIAISQISLLFGIISYLGLNLLSTENKTVLIITLLYSSTLLLALFIEIMRAWINYDYSLHPIRIMSLGVFTSMSGVFFTALVWYRFKNYVSKMLILICIIVLNLPRVLPINPDLITICILFLCAVVTLLGCITKVNGKHLEATGLSVAVIFTIGFAFIDPWLFLNNGIFLIGTILIFPTVVIQTIGSDKRSFDKKIIIKAQDEKISLIEKDIQFIKAAGNYSEISLLNNQVILIRAALKDINNQLPKIFLYVQRSYIVNMAHAMQIKSKPGSRYFLRLHDGKLIPISRSKVSMVKAAIPISE